MIATPSPAKAEQLWRRIERIVSTTPITDIHTHLYDPACRGLLLWGIDELLVYHYLVAEAFRYRELPFREFWELPKTRQAEIVWDSLFARHSPVSEACRGVLTTLNRLGLDPGKKDLDTLRRWYAKRKLADHVNRCLELARIERVYMTNSPFDNQERTLWEKGFVRDPRFVAALRIDSLLLDWPNAAAQLARWSYRVARDLSRRTVDETTRMLRDWAQRLSARYVMVSLPPDFAFPGRTHCARLLEHCVLPFCQEENLPLALMLGVKRAVNPALGLAGDGVGRSDLEALEHLCAGFPRNKFLVTVLSLENQHELGVLARKFRNLHLFGCWWFTNVPLAADHITRLRLELLGTSFTAQHSDARVLDQLIYKWDHFRQILTRVLHEKYADLARAGWQPSVQEIQRDVHELLGGAFDRFCALSL